MSAGFPCGGWCPEDRKAEDGRIPAIYPLVVLADSGYRQRTRKNVQDSDGAVIVYTDTLSGGTKLTRDLCKREQTAFVVIDAAQVSLREAIDGVCHFVSTYRVAALNVAGPRASAWAQGYAFARDLVGGVLGYQVATNSLNGQCDNSRTKQPTSASAAVVMPNSGG